MLDGGHEEDGTLGVSIGGYPGELEINMIGISMMSAGDQHVS